ncbi:MAG: DeoR/GlpR family DNA-binding transcription regulator, partial [Oscillospiraceae bacterium]
MLTDERYSLILEIIDKKNYTTVTELSTKLHVSESTIRRDLTALDKSKRLKKVFGGASSASKESSPAEPIQARYCSSCEQKREIAEYAAGLISPGDFIYIDASTTTELLIDYISQKDATYVTSGISIAKRLAQRGLKTFILAGHVMSNTDVVMGSESIDSLSRYHFSKGFFGTVGISVKEGFTTPEVPDARTKSCAMSRCETRF